MGDGSNVKKTIEGVGEFVFIDGEIWLCENPVNETLQYIDVETEAQGFLAPADLQLIEHIGQNLETYIKKAMAKFTAENPESAAKNGSLEYDGITILVEEDDDFEIDLSFSDWDEGFLNVVFKDGEPVDYYFGD